ncbi:hypothetical protein MSG28_000601 [Choristoneura fumiferana]|uniref:Uncharacterized protein n=1 Tax=Choristoneura fumiferana TaxID=7141 RepID=A0ACC0K1M9_CHOFU|nr:hypothetical protein MSG28_000601 [Choristoneura fumiferana]
MYYVSEAKLTNSKTDLLNHYHLKAPPEIFMTPIISNESSGNRVTFQSAMKLTMIIGQFFGLIPVIGVSETDTSKLRYRCGLCPQFAPLSFWRTMREDYSRLTYLVRRVDDAIGGIIFISFANNLFFICLQLLHTLTPLRGYEQATYFVYSFGFLIARSLAVSLIASRVHTASREPAQALYFVPSTAYCVEVQRFLDQIHGDTIALSGLQFFNVKRGLVLTIAGTIVTYELVLMQFTGVTPTPPPSTVTVPILINTSSTERTVEHICTHLRKHVYLEHVNARESNKCAYNVQHNAAQCRTLVEEHLYITDLNGTHLQQKFSV